jgi:ATP-dependent Lhr-like helicase
MAAAFSHLHETLQGILLERLGWDSLRPVQEEAYRAVGKGYDVLIIAPTAGGKTEAALIPVIDRLMKTGSGGICCLYLAPLKALINDQMERFSDFCSLSGLVVSAWHGDIPRAERTWIKGEPPDILMTTPESLSVLLQDEGAAEDLSRLQAVIIDEAHAFVESSRGVQMIALLDRIDQRVCRHVQRIALSATVGNPEEILDWIAGGREERALVHIPSVPKEKHVRFFIATDPETRLQVIQRTVSGKKSLIFVNSRSLAETLFRGLTGAASHVSVHHSSLSPAKRRASEEAMNGEGSACIICTSTLELGIDLGALDTVVQVGPPQTVTSFLQRLGRTGRRGKPATTAFVVRDPHELLVSVAILEAAERREAEPLSPPAYPYPAIAQQLLLSVIRGRRVPGERIIREVASLPVFSMVGQDEVRKLVSHAVLLGYFSSDGDLLMPGRLAEEEFGRANWKEIFSLITGGESYRAVTPDGDVVGTLDARFVAAGKKRGTFPLGGAGWEVLGTDDTRKVVVLGPGDGSMGGVFWSGGRGWLSPLVTRSMGRIAERGGTVVKLGESESAALGSAILEYPPGSGPDRIVCRVYNGPKGRAARIVTFAGGEANRLLSLLVRDELPASYRIGYDDTSLHIPRVRKGETAESVAMAVSRACSLPLDEQSRRLPAPARKTWKFAGMLTDDQFEKMVFSDYYLVPSVMEGFRNARVSAVSSGDDGTSEPPQGDNEH